MSDRLMRAAVMTLTWLSCQFYFRVLNRVSVIGESAYPEGTLYYANHVSFCDGFLFYFASGKRFRAPAKEKYFRSRLRKKIAAVWQVIPIKTDEEDKPAVIIRTLARVLKQNEGVLLFPEGKIGERLGLLQPGIAALIRAAGKEMKIVPVWIKTKRPSVLRKIEVRFGKPLAAGELKERSTLSILYFLRCRLAETAEIAN